MNTFQYISTYTCAGTYVPYPILLYLYMYILYAYPHLYIYIHVYTLTCTCAYTGTYTCTHTFTHVRTHTLRPAHVLEEYIHVCMYVCFIGIYPHLYTCAYPYP